MVAPDRVSTGTVRLRCSWLPVVLWPRYCRWELECSQSRSRSIVGTIGASLQTLIDGNITLLTNLCEQTREHAFDLMLQQAADLGANAVIGMRYDATEVMQGVTEVLANGTAVYVEKET